MEREKHARLPYLFRANPVRDSCCRNSRVGPFPFGKMWKNIQCISAINSVTVTIKLPIGWNPCREALITRLETDIPVWRTQTENPNFFFSQSIPFSLQIIVFSFSVAHVGDEGGESVRIEAAMAALSDSGNRKTNRENSLCLVSHPHWNRHSNLRLHNISEEFEEHGGVQCSQSSMGESWSGEDDRGGRENNGLWIRIREG